ncbi:hypothetical protein J3R30DRAFT_3405914 [Lentinula aciculospora]|uniref:Cytosine-specific methyltransferase n=1 Tax=Lentinula aciculospora TaxID=153920 RepID=A0A9W9A7G0_9AGAR|nr:hypothetical protein J3R30DRAFT_3405914 [Lentinula aciculospora]
MYVNLHGNEDYDKDRGVVHAAAPRHVAGEAGVTLDALYTEGKTSASSTFWKVKDPDVGKTPALIRPFSDRIKLASKVLGDGHRHRQAERKVDALEILLRLGKLSEDQYKEFSQVLEDYEEHYEEDENNIPSAANTIILTPRSTESPVTSPKVTKRTFGQTFSHVEIPIASPPLKRKSSHVLSSEHASTISKRRRLEEDADAVSEEEANRRWKGKERELARSSKATHEQPPLRTKSFATGLRAFVEIPVPPPSQKGRTSVKKDGAKRVADRTKRNTPSPSYFERRTGPSTSTTRSATARNPLAVDDDDFEFSSESDTSLYESDKDSRTRPSRSSTTSRAIETKSALTPNVHRIAHPFFRHTFEVIGPDLSGKKIMNETPTNYMSHPGLPQSMKWGKKLAVEGGRTFYETLDMEGELYEVGDVVMVEPGEDDRKGRQGNYKSEASQSKNGSANRFWFIQICYFFEEADDCWKKFHGRWLEHGSKTFLQETAHSRGLYLTNTCEDEPASSIYRKCDIKFLGLNELEPEDDVNYEGDSYFCQYTWLDSDDPTFLSLPQPEEVQSDLSFAPSHSRCHSCVLNDRLGQQRVVQKIGNCISQFNVDYHEHDFIYIRPFKPDDEQLDVAQIIAILNSTTLKLLLKLGRTEHTIPFEQADGKCFVSCFSHPSGHKFADWIKDRDHYYVLDSENFKQCEDCMTEHERHLAACKYYLTKEGPLSMLELFSGAGGFGTGLEQSNIAKTIAAVEYDHNAAETYQLNHADTAVFCKDVVELLREIENGDEIESLNGKPFPKPGDVDILAGGPPCQAFSGANHYKKQDDIRATLPFVMLSYAEIYLPKYFLLENVVGLLRHRLLGRLEGRSIVDGVKHGVFKLITRILLALGYQVRVKVLQAANYGAPQSRERVIFWGARQGLKLPEFPIPTHTFAAKEHHLLEHADLKLSRSTRSRDPERPHFFAPFRAVTVHDAIADLPAFDWYKLVAIDIDFLYS